MDEIDETAFQTLLASGVDVPTALAGSQRDQPKPPASKVNRWAVLAGILFVLWVLLK